MKMLSSRDNPAVKRLHALAGSARERKKQGATVLDGAHLVRAAIEAGWVLQSVYVSESGLLSAEIVDLTALLERDTSVVCLPDTLFRHVSPVETPSGILAELAIPPEPEEMVFSGSIVVLDGIQDPGNLGTILRTAAAVGIREAILTNDCAQAWSPKVLRAGMGAHFLMQFFEKNNMIDAIKNFSGKVVATTLAQNAQSLYASDLRGAVAWLFGAEGRGLSEALLTYADIAVKIPLAGNVESLNVASAAAVCLFEQRRQQQGL